MRRRIVFGLAAGLFLLAGLDRSAWSDAALEGQRATFAGSIRLTSPDPGFGGFSALEVGPDGTDLIAISDRGASVAGRLLRDGRGNPSGVKLGPVTPLKTADGLPVVGPWVDAEGVALGPKGIYVSFEIMPRIAIYPALDAAPSYLPTNPAFDSLPRNQGLEALAIDPDGAVYAVAEAPKGRKLRVFVHRDGSGWAELAIDRIGNFRPVAADFSPDGRFYLLERRFDGVAGFASQLRRFNVTKAGFSPGEMLLKTRTGQHDNLEGLSVWRAPDGLRATMISDDNFFRLQVTEIVEYRLPD